MEDDMITRLLVGTIVAGILTFGLGYLAYGVALDSFMQANTSQYPFLLKRPPNLVLLVMAHLAFGALLSLVAEYWAKARSFASGLQVGAPVTFLVACWTDLIVEANMELFMGVIPMIVDVVVATVIGAITGGVIGLVLGKMDKTAETA